MGDFSGILDMLQALQQQVEAITEAVGRLQADAELASAAEPAAAEVMAPTAPAVEIVGGEETEQFPDCCAVGNDLGYYCSGTLIAPNVVVTADHCKRVTQVFLQGNDVSRPEDGQTIRVTKQFTHPELDLRVLVLEGEAGLAPRHVAQGDEAHAEWATLVGFGTIDYRGKIGYGIKRMVKVPITSLDCSDPGHPKRYGCLAGREMVAGHRGLRLDSCRGDSGGPLYIENGDGEYYLLGATSRGQRERFTICGDGGIYVRVDLCLDWIREVTGAEIEGPRN